MITSILHNSSLKGILRTKIFARLSILFCFTVLTSATASAPELFSHPHALWRLWKAAAYLDLNPPLLAAAYLVVFP